MEHIAALLLIVGCSGNLEECRELPAPAPIFETMKECQSELPVSLRDAQGKDVRVFANCVFVDPAMAEEDAVLEWDVTNDGGLVATVTADDGTTVIASSQNKANNPVR